MLSVVINKLIYDAENRLITLTERNLISHFTYYGEGKRVKSVVNGEPIYFVGGYFEQKGSEITKYYMAGASRVAMRRYTIPQSMTVEYLLGDHLGSTSITTDTNGAKVSEMRYKPWGETRYSWTDPNLNTTPMYELTRYQFTGQYSNDAEFGLKYYGARWYDSTIGRFAQADTIVPGGVQGYDRYTYGSNNPVRYIDPSGHESCEETDDAGNCIDVEEKIINEIESTYDVEITGGWNVDELLLLQISLNKTAAYLGGAYNLNHAIQVSLDAKGLDKDRLTFYNLPGSGHCSGQSFNCYDPDSGTITISDGAFTQSYQAQKNRPPELKLNSTDMGVQVSIVHELAHMLHIARPVALMLYSNKKIVSDPLATDRVHGHEENMANAIAYYVVSGGGASSRFQGQLDFAANYAYLWTNY